MTNRTSRPVSIKMGMSVLALFLVPPAPVSAQAIDRNLDHACWNTLEGCRAWWIVYASLQGGGIWYQDKMGTDPRARATERQLNAIVSRLRRCAVKASSAPTSWFLDFTQDLAIVFSGPFRTAAEARGDLERARRCGVSGYAKASRFVHFGND